MNPAVAVVILLVGVGLIAWGAEAFAEHLGAAAVALRVSTFALAVLLAGAEPEELATGVIGSLRHVPAVTYGDVIGANVAMCLAAFGIGAVLAPVVFTTAGLRYGLLALPAGILCAALAWTGHLGRPAGAVLVGAYLAYVAVIWKLEGRPPAIGEASELQEAREKAAHRPTDLPRRTGRDLAIVVGAMIAMAGGGWALVTGLEDFTPAAGAQTTLSLTLVGFATAFELIVLAVSAARRGKSDILVGAVVGSFAYNATMTLGASALARPLNLAGAGQLHLPLVTMVAALALILIIGLKQRCLNRPTGIILIAAYAGWTAVIVT